MKSGRKSDILFTLAREAGFGIIDPIETMEQIGGRGFCANYEELGRFAKIVGQKAREDERQKLTDS